MRRVALAGALLTVAAAGAHAWTHIDPATGSCTLPLYWQAWLYVAR